MNPNQFMTIYGSVIVFIFVVVVVFFEVSSEIAAPLGYRTVDFDSIDATFAVFMRNTLTSVF